MSAFVPRSGPGWWRQLAGLPPLPVPAPVGGLACTALVVAPGVGARAPALGPVGYVQHAPAGSNLTVRLVGLVDDTTGAPVADATVVVAITDAAGAPVTSVTLPNLPAADGGVCGDYELPLAAPLAPGRYACAAVATGAGANGQPRQLTVAAVVVVGPYYGG